MFKSIGEIKKIGYDKELNDITNKLPGNKQICENILKKLNNDTTKIKEDDGKEASLYLIVSDSILIANIKESFTRVQTIAHECLHSIQSKKLLWFNYIFSNIYMLYFMVILILALFNKTGNNWVFALILFLAGFVFYVVRSYLEMDAMTKARFVAQDYLQENLGTLTQEEIDLVISKYDYLNSKGIWLTMLLLAWKCILKLIIFGIICII